MRSIKVLEVVSGLGLGGAEKALISRLKYRPNGVESQILNIRPQIDSLTAPSDVKLFQNEGNFAQNIFVLYKNIHDFNPDIVIVRTPADVIRLAIVKLIFRQRFCFVFEAHSNFVTKKRFVGEIFRLLFNLATLQLQGIIAVSKSVKDGPLCKVSIPVKVCYLGSDIQLKGSEIDEIKNARFLFLGRMVDIKRPLWLIERINNLRDQVTLGKGCLTIVGDGPLLEDARKLISTLDLKDFVTLTGQQSDVVPYLLESNYLVSCSENEGLPITFYEAKLAGLRIISTPSGGGVEIFGENDFVTSGFSEIEFEAALVRAISDPLPSLIERRKTSEAASWMSAQSCAVNYYEALVAFLGRAEFR